MGKILYSQVTEKGSVHYISGTVTSIRENKDANHPFNLEIVASVFNGETKTWSLKNINLQSWEGNSWSCIDRIKTMKVQVGSAVLCRCGNLKEYEYTGKSGKTYSGLQAPLFSIMYDYKWELEPEKKNNLYLLCGTVKNIHEYKDGSATVTVNIGEYDHDKKKASTVAYDCEVDDKTYTALKKKKVAKGGTLSCVGFLDDKKLEVKRADFNERMKKDGKESA